MTTFLLLYGIPLLMGGYLILDVIAEKIARFRLRKLLKNA